MEPEQQPPVPQPEEPTHSSHTYQDDLADAMDTTDPAAVQTLLNQARDQEKEAVEVAHEMNERKWYSLSSFFLLILTLGVLGYGTYYYMHLTVKTVPVSSVGVFQNTDVIDSSSTTIKQVLSSLITSTTLPVGKATLVNLVTDTQSNTLLTNSQFYSFIGADLSEPLQSVVGVARLGVINTGKEIVPFIIASVPDAEKASKEFGIAEPSLLQAFYQALNIDISGYALDTLPSFQSQYFYNLPVRTLTIPNSTTQQQNLVFLYGYASTNTIVITSKPEALKAVYDTVINQ